MERARDFLAGPSGPGAVTVFLLLMLAFADGHPEAGIVGAGAAMAFDPIIVVVLFITSIASRRWWHVVIGAIIAAGIVWLRPTSPYLQDNSGWATVKALGAFTFVTLLTAIAAPFVSRFRHHPGYVGEGDHSE